MPASATVFVVDDDAGMGTLYDSLFKSVNLKVKVYASAIQFLEDYQLDLPGCLIVDMKLPEMSGLALQEKLCEIDCRLPVIFVSSYADIRMVVKAMSNGALDFLEKPFHHQELMDRVHVAIRQDALQHKKKKELDRLKDSYTRLTQRERAIADLVVDGLSNKQIAAHFGVTTQAIDACRGRAMKKLNVDSVAELVHHAVQLKYFRTST